MCNLYRHRIARDLVVACGIAIATSLVVTRADSRAAEPPADLKPIGGRWFVKPGDKPVYFYRDGDRFVDLFSYHTADSNKDGIDNIRLSHDPQFLVMASQGYPNHPTAIFPNSGN